MSPTVSIITPLYNAAAFLDETIRSVQAQKFTDYEHLIIDNNSTDDSPAIARRAAQRDDRIRLLRHDRAQGAAVTRNVGIEAARGRYIAFLDSDDLWAPEKLRLQFWAMEHAQAAFSWTAYDVIGDDGRWRRRQGAVEQGTANDFLNRRMVIGCLTAMYDSHALGKMYMTYPEPPEDFCLWMDILTRCEEHDLPVVGVNAPLASYRAHPQGNSAAKHMAAAAYWRACRAHLGLSRLRTAWHFTQYAAHGVSVRLQS